MDIYYILIGDLLKLLHLYKKCLKVKILFSFFISLIKTNARDIQKLKYLLLHSLFSESNISFSSLQEHVIESFFILSPLHITPGLSPQTSKHRFPKRKMIKFRNYNLRKHKVICTFITF